MSKVCIGTPPMDGEEPPIDFEELERELSKFLTENPELGRLLTSSDSEDPYGVSMEKLAMLLVSLHKAKDAQYGRSWARRGESGIYHNFMRKEDRLEQLAILSMLGTDMYEYRIALIDTLMDRAAYGLMWISNMSKKYPEAFQAWVVRVWCNATGIDFTDVVKLLDEK